MRQILILLTLAVSITVNAQQKEITVPFSSATEAKSIDIQLFHGDIKIMGSNRSDVLIKYEVEDKVDHDHRSNDEKSKGMKKIGGGNFEFEIGERNNEVKIHSQNFMNLIRLEVEVPMQTAIDISKQMGENVWIENVNGDINVENNIGSVTIKGVSGSVNASSSTGEIVVEFNQINADQNMTFNTITGNIDLTIPESHKANLKMRTEWGDIYSDLPVSTVEREGENTKVVGDSGMKVITNNWTYGTLNGGGPEMTIKTQMGSIYLRKK